MATMTMGKVRATLGKTVSRVERRGQRIVLRRRGKPVAVLVPVEDLALLERVEDAIDVHAAKKALSEPGAAISLEQVAAALDEDAKDDEADAAEAMRRLADRKEVPVPYEAARRRLGLA